MEKGSHLSSLFPSVFTCYSKDLVKNVPLLVRKSNVGSRMNSLCIAEGQRRIYCSMCCLGIFIHSWQNPNQISGESKSRLSTPDVRDTCFWSVLVDVNQLPDSSLCFFKNHFLYSKIEILVF